MKHFRFFPLIVLFLVTLTTGCHKKVPAPDPYQITGVWAVRNSANSGLVSDWQQIAFEPNGDLEITRINPSTGECYRSSGKYWFGMIQYPDMSIVQKDDNLTIKVNTPSNGSFGAMILTFRIESRSKKQFGLSYKLIDPSSGEKSGGEFALVRIK